MKINRNKINRQIENRSRYIDSRVSELVNTDIELLVSQQEAEIDDMSKKIKEMIDEENVESIDNYNDLIVELFLFSK